MKSKTKSSLFIIISAFFYAGYGVWSRLMADSFGEFNQAWTRAIALLSILIVYLAITKSFKPIKKKDLKWFIVIGFMGLNQAPYYYGFNNLPIGTAILIFYIMVVIAGFILGKLLFGETITRVKQLSLALGIIGISIVYKFSLTSSQIIPAIGMTIAGFMGGTGAILPKKLSKNYPEPQIMTSYLLVMIIANSILSVVFKETLPPLSHTTAWLSQAGYAASMLIANLSVIAGFKYLEASIGSLIGLVEILFGIAFGFLLFSEPLTISTAMGAALIITAAILPNLKKKTQS